VSGQGETTTQLRDAADSLSGTRLENPFKAAAALSDHNWSAAVIDVVGIGADTVMARVDPLGTATANGTAWLIDHVDPLKRWADELTGDPEVVARRAGALLTLAGELTEVAVDLRRDADGALEGQRGLSVQGYRRALLEDAREVERAAAATEAVGRALERAAVVVEAVRSFVVGLISEVLGRAAAKGIVAATGVGATLALAAMSRDAISTAARARRALDALTDCLRVLRTQLRHLAEEVRGIAVHAVRRQTRAAPRHRGAPTETVAGRLANVAVGPAVGTAVSTADRHASNRQEHA